MIAFFLLLISVFSEVFTIKIHGNYGDIKHKSIGDCYVMR